MNIEFYPGLSLVLITLKIINMERRGLGTGIYASLQVKNTQVGKIAIFEIADGHLCCHVTDLTVADQARG